MSRPRCWPMTITVSPSSRAQPPTIAASSRNARSPCSSMKSVKHELDVVERERALRAARDLHALPRREVLVDLLAQVGELLLERRDLFVDVELLPAGEPLQLVDLLFQLDDRLLELQSHGSRPRQLPRTRRTRSAPKQRAQLGQRGLRWPRCATSATEPRARPVPSLHCTSSGGDAACDVAWLSTTARTSRITSGVRAAVPSVSVDRDRHLPRSTASRRTASPTRR